MTEIKISILIILVSFAGFLVFNLANAATCGSLNIIGSSPPYWGTNANQNISVVKGSQVRITVKGEDGCVAQFAEFRIYKGPSLIKTIKTQLIWQDLVPNQPNAKYLGGDWTIDVDQGTYSVKLLKVGNTIYSSSLSSNTLAIQQSQQCNLSRAYTNPTGGVRAGQQIQLIVEAQGACQDWEATVNVLGNFSVCNFNGSKQKFSSGNNRLVWNWTSQNSKEPQAVCRFKANLGNQSLESSPFTILRVGGQPPAKTTSVSFEIENPIQAKSLVDLAKAIGRFLLQIAIPIAVIIIIYSGLLFLTSGGNKDKVAKARTALLYAIVGLAIILIGQGFFPLIKSILDLGR